MSAAFLTAAAAGMVGASAGAPNSATNSRAETAALDANRYYIDSLFPRRPRHDSPPKT